MVAQPPLSAATLSEIPSRFISDAAICLRSWNLTWSNPCFFINLVNREYIALAVIVVAYISSLSKIMRFNLSEILITRLDESVFASSFSTLLPPTVIMTFSIYSRSPLIAVFFIPRTSDILRHKQSAKSTGSSIGVPRTALTTSSAVGRFCFNCFVRRGNLTFGT